MAIRTYQQAVQDDINAAHEAGFQNAIAILHAFKAQAAADPDVDGQYLDGIDDAIMALEGAE